LTVLCVSRFAFRFKTKTNFKRIHYVKFLYVFVRDGGKCERFAFRFVPKKNETHAPYSLLYNDSVPLRRSRRSAARGSGGGEPELAESAESFAALVQRQLGTTRRNYAKWQLAVKKEAAAAEEFSSDEL
jgi:hypothetical protein